MKKIMIALAAFFFVGFVYSQQKRKGYSIKNLEKQERPTFEIKNRQTITYCVSKGDKISDEYIQKVEIGTINNSAETSSGYSDFTNISTTLKKSNEVTINITPKWTDTVYSEGYAVFIDYNQDGDFNDENETVFSKDPSKDASITGSFTIPESAKEGETRMRVSLKYDGVPVGCETFEYGEVEDYTVIIANSDTEAPTAPTNVVVSNIEKRSATLSWTASTDNVGIYYYIVYINGEPEITITETTVNITYLTPNTEYNIDISAIDKAENESPKTSINFITKSLPPGVYCESKGNKNELSYIEKVELGTISNSSDGGTGYTDFTSISTKLSKTETITITSKRPKTTPVEDAYAVFIDYNQDGDFQDEGETVFTKEPIADAVIKETFTIPDTAKPGETRMRISMKFGKIPTPCEFFNFGEVEDYTVIIQDTQPPTAPTELVVSDIKERSATLSWTESTDNVGVEYYTIHVAGQDDLASAEPTINLKNLLPDTTYTVTVKALDEVGNISADASITFKTEETTTTGYCESKGNNITDEYIEKVEIGAISNSATTSSGYTDFTSISTTEKKSDSVRISITPKWTDTIYNEGYAVFVDYNQDGDFDDEGETVFSKDPSKDTLITGSFIIPESAKEGKTRMRVSLKYKGVPKGCEIFEYGEVEDYTIFIENNIIDTEPPTAPTNLVISNLKKRSATLSWTASTDNVGVEYYTIYVGKNPEIAEPSTMVDLVRLTPNTEYNLYVSAVDKAGNESSKVPITFTTPSTAPGVYCESKGNIVSSEYIQRVELGAINNSSDGGSGYTDFTSISTEVSKSTVLTITITSKKDSEFLDDGFAVFIDYNQDGDFQDSNERVWSKEPSRDTSVTGSFTIPTSALNGETRMRVSMKFRGVPTPCEFFRHGEVEDYKVIIKDDSASQRSFLDVGLYPNPASNYLKVFSNNDKIENKNYRLINIFGQTVKRGKLNTNTINISNLPSGIYTFEVSTGQKVLTTKLIKRN